MKIINPSAEIIEPELAGLSVCQRIDRCASVCYQRPPKPTEEDAEAFCRSLIERGHLPALEMAVVHLIVPSVHSIEFWGQKYILANVIVGTNLCVASGSVRAFMELDRALYLRRFMADNYQLFFSANDGQRDERIRFATPEEIPWQHKHVAVRLVCSRAISHQLVRHRPCSFLQESQRYCRYDDEVTFVRPEWAGRSRALQWEHWEYTMEIMERTYQALMAEGLSPQAARGVLPNDTKTELIMYASLPEWRHIFAMRCAKAADPEMRRIMVPLRDQFKTEYPEMWRGE